VPTPAAFVCATIHVIHEDAFLIDDIELVSVLVQIKEKNSSWKSIGVLIVLLQRLVLAAPTVFLVRDGQIPQEISRRS